VCNRDFVTSSAGPQFQSNLLSKRVSLRMPNFRQSLLLVSLFVPGFLFQVSLVEVDLSHLRSHYFTPAPVQQRTLMNNTEISYITFENHALIPSLITDQPFGSKVPVSYTQPQ
jgi:hypothetical protein